MLTNIKNIRDGVFLIVMFLTSSAGAWVCTKDGWEIEHWIAAWKNHSEILPNYSSPNYGATNPVTSPGPFSVTSDLGGLGMQTVEGQAWCSANSSTEPTTVIVTGWIPSCWCRRTSPKGIGPWVFLNGDGGSSSCTHCANFCAYCITTGALHSCTRTAVLN